MADEDLIPDEAEAEGGEGELDTMASDMLKMMEEGGLEEEEEGGSADQEELDKLMEMEMLKAMEEGGEGEAPSAGEIAAEPSEQPVQGPSRKSPGSLSNIDRLKDVTVAVEVEWGQTRRTISNIMELSESSLIELDRLAGEPVDILVNGKLFARGEVVVVQENFGVKVTELLTPMEDIGTLDIF